MATDVVYAVTPRVLWCEKIVDYENGSDVSQSVSAAIDTSGLRFVMFTLDWGAGYAMSGVQVRLYGHYERAADLGAQALEPDVVIGAATDSGAGVIDITSQANGHCRIIWERPTRWVHIAFQAGDLPGNGHTGSVIGTLYGTH